jgi:glycosyltransferase involved in cell wall biosynthesis
VNRVLHLIDTGGPGGAETVMANLVEALPADRWSSRVIVPREDWLFSRLKDGRSEVRVIPNRGSTDTRLLRRLMGEVRCFQPSLIHAHFLGSGVYGTLASILTNHCPLVCTFHGPPDVRGSDRLLPLKARILSRDRNRIIYVSGHLREYLEPIMGVPDRLGLVIRNGVRLPEPVDAGPARRSLGLPPGVTVIGAVGNVRKAKDYPNLLRAAQIVCAQRPDVHFAVIGQWDSMLGEEVSRLREKWRLVERVHFLGFREDAATLMSGFDVFVSSSSSEGLPLATLEAMGLGKPMVLTRCGGVPEMVEDGRTGILVPAGNPGALAAAILRLLEAPDVAVQLGARARLSAKERFSLSSMVAGHEQLYGMLVDQYPVRHA